MGSPRPSEARMARAVALVAALVAGAGLWASVAAEARCWGPEAAGLSQAGRWWLIPLLAAPHVVALGSAVVSRPSLTCSALVLSGAAVTTWLAVAVWHTDSVSRTEGVRGLLQAWGFRVLVCGVGIGGGLGAWQERHRRPKNAERTAAANPAT